MLWITELTDTKIIFQFYERELPESISLGKKTKVNHIEYPGGFQTNQIIGVFDKSVEWTGLFYGTYRINGEVVTAKERAEVIKTLMGRPLRFGFPVPGMNKDNEIPGRTEVTTTSSDAYIGGDTGVYIIEEFDPDVRDYFNVEYKIKLIPHQSVEKVKPEQTTSVKITVNLNNVSGPVAKIRAVTGKSNHSAVRKANTAAANGSKWEKGMIPRGSDRAGNNSNNQGFQQRPTLRIPSNASPTGKPTYDPPTYDSKGKKIR